MRQEILVLECDLCKTEGEGVETHAVTVDKKTVELEACGRCWAKVEKPMVAVFEAGRKRRRTRAA